MADPTAERPTLNPALRDFWTTPARVRVLYGGRFSSKTWDAAGFAVYLAANYRVRFLCTRQFQNKIEESVYTVIKHQIERFGLLGEFTIYQPSGGGKIVHNDTGSEFIFYGLWRHIDEIKSLEGVDICWIEEAHNLREDQWRILRDTVRKEGSQFWIVFNPRFQTDFVYQRFVANPPPRTLVRKINYDENPFLSETALETAEEVRQEDEEEYRHVYLGEPRTDDDRVIIKRSWIEAAVDAHKALGIEPTGKARVGFDVADDGDDLNAQVAVKGVVATFAEEWKGLEDELLKSCTRVWHKARESGAEIVYDAIGVGAASGNKFNELNETIPQRRRIQHEAFNAGGAVIRPDKEYAHDVLNKDQFANLKAQAWWLVADRFRATYNAVVKGESFDSDEVISIDGDMPHLEKLISELSTPRRDFNSAGKVKVESKEDLAKREVPSPNLADAFIMAYAPSEKTAGIQGLTTW